MDQLRAANEQLVIRSLRMQELADEASVARADAEAANRLKDDFLATVSHELRTPLSAVIGWARLLSVGHLDPTAAVAAARTIEQNAQELTRMIDDLLDASRILSGRVGGLALVPVDLVAAAKAAVDQVRFTADAKGVRLAFSWPSAPVAVAGDVLRLQQVVANLLSNAIKFTPPGGRVDLEVTATVSHAEVRVADTGLGIDPAFLPRIFDRFEQADTSMARRHGGLGLGLSIVRGFVEAHGGTVHAESPGIGHGATFTVRLPILPARDAELLAAPGATTTAPAAGAARLDGICVVLVENDPSTRRALTLLLELTGAKVMSFEAVRETLAALDTIEPHVILSDIGMPGEDGFTLVREVRAREAQRGARRIPAIGMTGYGDPEDRARVLAAGYDVYLRKPFDVTELVPVIVSLTGNRRAA